MKIRHTILIVLFALLQGMAPLLHAHLGADATGPSGVHMHGAPSGATDGDGQTHWSGAGPIESPAVGLGQEIRRDLTWQPVHVAPAILPDWSLSPLPVHRPPATVDLALPAHVAFRVVPPSHAPPSATH